MSPTTSTPTHRTREDGLPSGSHHPRLNLRYRPLILKTPSHLPSSILGFIDFTTKVRLPGFILLFSVLLRPPFLCSFLRFSFRLN